ncbi:MAG: helix-turn-helix transcriptional regulator [Lachnospiraceae bacterium]|nr:helix-turn-helix transcriptional regulator [Lachnospiraceae bacterium]
MSMNKELNAKLWERREEQTHHVEYDHEYKYYDNIAEGRIEEVQKVLADPKDITRYEEPEYGKLSKDFLRNMRYHFVVSTALITRLCVEKGLERELAYTLSDLYIGKMDIAKTAEQIIILHNEMLMDFTCKMADLPKQKVYSIQIVKAIEYIQKNRNSKLTVQDIADKLHINRSYLSSLFKKETGKTISDFIREEKIRAAANMLKFSEYSYGDIAKYFGFASQSHFIECFRKQTGLSPKEYRKKYSRNQELFAGKSLE